MTRANFFGWHKPTAKPYARCKAGPETNVILAGVVPAPKVDLAKLVTIIDQGALGSCTCNSTAQIIHAAMDRVADARAGAAIDGIVLVPRPPGLAMGITPLTG